MDYKKLIKITDGVGSDARLQEALNPDDYIRENDEDITDSKITDSYDMESLPYLDIENYEATEGGCMVGDQYVCLNCMSDPSAAQWDDVEDEYPYVYEVEVIVNYGQDDERSAMGESKQWSSEDSAFHDGFEPAYKKACRQLGVTPLLK